MSSSESELPDPSVLEDGSGIPTPDNDPRGEASIPNGDDLVALGEVMGNFGVRGDLRVKMHNPDSDLLLELDKVFLVHPDGTPSEVAVRKASLHGKGMLMSLAGIRNREQARAAFGLQIAVRRSQLPEPAEDEFYLVDAIGAQVVLTDGTKWGVVESFRAYPSSDVLCVRCSDGLRELPLLEPYLVAARIDVGEIVVDHVQDLGLEPESGRK